jgi:hypothetical protein
MVINKTHISLLSLMLLLGVSAYATAPASQNFDAILPQESTRGQNPSLTLDGVIYSTDADDDVVVVDTIDAITGYLPTLGTGNAIGSVWYGNNGTYFQFASELSANDFRLVSLRAEVWGNPTGMAELYEVTAYNEGGIVGSATVDFGASGIYGVGDFSITYLRQTTLEEELSAYGGANAGLLTFGAGWDNIDQVRFTVADGFLLGITMDEIVFAEPSGSPIPEPSTYAAIFGVSALGLAIWRRRRQA